MLFFKPTSLYWKVFDSVSPYIVKLISSCLLTRSAPRFSKQAALSPILKKSDLYPTELSKYQNDLFLLKLCRSQWMGSWLLSWQGVMPYINFSLQCTLQCPWKSLIFMAAVSCQCIVLVLVDLLSAFETVDHKIVLLWLQNAVGISGIVFEWFSYSLSNRAFWMFANNKV